MGFRELRNALMLLVAFVLVAAVMVEIAQRTGPCEVGVPVEQGGCPEL